MGALFFLAGKSEAQFATGVVDYSPAPGQYTNADNIGTPAAAQSIVGTNKGLVSLGAFGGSVVVYFANGIDDDPGNPYGVDFTIYGNPTPTWSEPGIIQVMKDENGNGLPDDTWYEIAGSDHFWNNTKANYKVTYHNNGLDVAGDIPWTDNQGQSGIVPKNSFHLQPYYPSESLFPKVDRVQYSRSGTRIAGQIDLSNNTSVKSYRRAFGYADNTVVQSFTQKLPDNPYTPEVEGSGGDAIDIGWAIDQNGNHVQLDKIHFIRIYTGMNALVGWLGEVSTEVTGIRDVEPASVSGTTSMVVIQDLPAKMAAGSSLSLNALYFEKGIPQKNEALTWTVDQPDKATIENNQLKALHSGTIRLKVSSVNHPEIFAEKELSIFEGAKCTITLASNTLKVNDKLDLNGKITDLDGNLLSGISAIWRLENNGVAAIYEMDGKPYILGKQAGKCWLYMETALAGSKGDSLQLTVLPESGAKKVYISVKTDDQTIIPRHSLPVEQFDFTSKVDRHEKNYGLNQVGFVSLAHAICAAFNEAGISDFDFRDDATGGSALYLWKVPVDDEGSTVNVYGYGGSRTSDSYRKTWVVLLNQQMMVGGFDQINVNNNDEILIYHLTDNNLPWSVTQLLAGNDTVKMGQEVNIQLRKYTCSMNENRQVIVQKTETVNGQPVQVIANGKSRNLVTDDMGNASFVAIETGIYSINAGIDKAILVAESSTKTINPASANGSVHVFPNPFIDQITVSGLEGFVNFSVSDLQGKSILSGKAGSQHIDLGVLLPGIYLLKLESAGKVSYQKIVKK